MFGLISLLLWALADTDGAGHQYGQSQLPQPQAQPHGAAGGAGNPTYWWLTPTNAFLQNNDYPAHLSGGGRPASPQSFTPQQSPHCKPGHDCVPWALCADGVINHSGIGLIDVRLGGGPPPSNSYVTCGATGNVCCRIPETIIQQQSQQSNYGYTPPFGPPPGVPPSGPSPAVPPSGPPYPSCSAGLLCVDKSRCNLYTGFIGETVQRHPNEQFVQVNLCTDENILEGVCCQPDPRTLPVPSGGYDSGAYRPPGPPPQTGHTPTPPPYVPAPPAVHVPAPPPVHIPGPPPVHVPAPPPVHVPAPPLVHVPTPPPVHVPTPPPVHVPAPPPIHVPAPPPVHVPAPQVPYVPGSQPPHVPAPAPHVPAPSVTYGPLGSGTQPQPSVVAPQGSPVQPVAPYSGPGQLSGSAGISGQISAGGSISHGPGVVSVQVSPGSGHPGPVGSVGGTVGQVPAGGGVGPTYGPGISTGGSGGVVHGPGFPGGPSGPPAGVRKCPPNKECVPFYLCIDGVINTDGAGLIDVRDKPLQPIDPQLQICSTSLQSANTPPEVCCGFTPDPSPVTSCGGGLVCLEASSCAPVGAAGGYSNTAQACYMPSGNPGVCCPPLPLPPPIPILETCPAQSVCLPENLCKGEIVDASGNFVVYASGGTWSKCSYSGATNSGVCCKNPPTASCGVSNYGQQDFLDIIDLRNLQKNDAQFGEFPWQAIIFFSNFTFNCGATLLSDRVLATAAHCVYKYSPHDLKVRLGEWRVSVFDEPYPYEDYDVTDIIVHEWFNIHNVHNDIALLVLNKPVQFGYHINSICLPPHGLQFSSPTRCFVSGWGKDAFEGDFQHTLKKIELPIVNKPHCQDLLRNTRLEEYFVLHDSFMCAGGEANKDACKGDGGGPLACLDPGARPGEPRYMLAGLTAWGIGCGQPNVPGVYVDVSYFVSWIEGKMAHIQGAYGKK